MLNIQSLSSNTLETWVGVDINTLGPIYPMIGSEFILFIIGIVFWIGFHVVQLKIENKELKADVEAARDPERLKRVFAKEAQHY